MPENAFAGLRIALGLHGKADAIARDFVAIAAIEALLDQDVDALVVNRNILRVKAGDGRRPLAFGMSAAP